MKKLLAGVGVLTLILVISCGKEKEVRPYNGHFVTAVSLHPELVKSLVAEKQFDPSQNCVQLVEYSRTPNKSSRSDFYLLFSPNACPANNETVEQFAFASEVQGLEQKANSMRLFNRLNELVAFNAVRPEVLSGWLERKVENDKVSGYFVSEICNFSIIPKTTSISGCELRIENGRFAIPRDTSLTAKHDQDERTALDQQRTSKAAADESREDVIAHSNALHDVQVNLINQRFTELSNYLVKSFGDVNQNIDTTRTEIQKQIKRLDKKIAKQFWAQLKRLNEVEKKVLTDLSKKIEDEAKATNTLVLALKDDVKALDDKVDKNNKEQVATLDKLKTALDGLSTAVGDVRNDIAKAVGDVRNDINASTLVITKLMTLEMWMTNLNINLVRLGQKDMAKKVDARIKELQASSAEETKRALARTSAHFDLFKMIETELEKLGDSRVKNALSELKRSNSTYQKQIADLTKAVEALDKKEVAPLPREVPQELPPAIPPAIPKDEEIPQTK